MLSRATAALIALFGEPSGLGHFLSIIFLRTLSNLCLVVQGMISELAASIASIMVFDLCGKRASTIDSSIIYLLFFPLYFRHHHFIGCALGFTSAVLQRFLKLLLLLS